MFACCFAVSQPLSDDITLDCWSGTGTGTTVKSVMPHIQVITLFLLRVHLIWNHDHFRS